MAANKKIAKPEATKKIQVELKNLQFGPQIYFWVALFALVIILVWGLGEVLAPFVTGMAIAYLLDPMVTSLAKALPKKMDRGVASLIVLVFFILIVLSVILIVSPLVGRQISGFVSDIPHYWERLYNMGSQYAEIFMDRMRPEDVEKVREAASNQVGNVLKGAQNVVGRIWSGGMAVIDIITFLMITPIVAFYCLRDWPEITNKVDDLLPRQSAETMRDMMAEFNDRLSGFVRGQMLVCLCLGTFYGVALSLLGLNFGLAIGLIAGFLSFIPYIGSIVGFVSSVGVALVQYSDDYRMVGVVMGIFFVGQFVEGNFLTPKIVGERIGLHAVWVIFALMAGGKLLGFTGMLLAVPLAAMIGVVVRYALIWYQQSPAYTGEAIKGA